MGWATAPAGSRLMPTDDPDAVEARSTRWPPPAGADAAASFLPMGGKRGAAAPGAAPAARARRRHRSTVVPLPAGAPFGSLAVDTAGCTLCLACVGACPTGALIDNPERPMLRFLEDACVQCGLCQNTCPEQVIRLEPRLNFTAEPPAARA